MRAVVATFNAQMARELPRARLARAWAAYEALFGRYLGHGRPVTVALGTLIVIRVPLHMSRRPGESPESCSGRA